MYGAHYNVTFQLQYSYRYQVFLGLIAAILLGTTGCVHKKSVSVPSAVSLAEQVARAHDPALQADFFRIIFVAQGTTVDHLARPGALRGFFGASSYYLVPMPLNQMLTYPGLADAPQKALVALRCKPANMNEVQPVLATWPNVLRAISTDLAEKKLTCPPNPGDAENEAFCIAQHYQDAAGENVTRRRVRRRSCVSSERRSSIGSTTTWLS